MASWLMPKNCNRNRILSCKYKFLALLLVVYTSWMQVSWSKPASKGFAENQSDHIEVLFRKAVHSLITRVLSSSSTIFNAVCPGHALARIAVYT